MAFTAANFSLITESTVQGLPRIFGYQAPTGDTIDVILTSGYFNFTTNYPLPTGLQQILAVGDMLLVLDPTGNQYQLETVNASGNITLQVVSPYVSQTKMINFNSAQTINDLPPIGYITKIQAVLDTQISGASNGFTFYQGANSIGSFIVATGDTSGTIYSVTLTTTPAYRTFDGNTALRIVSTGTGTGTSNIKFLVSLASPAR